MSDTTVHQHYVWRYYLRQWATNEQIICLRDRNKIFPVNLMKIAQEKLFYQFCESSETDFLIARHMADDCSIKLIEVYEIINAFLRTKSNKLKKRLKNSPENIIVFKDTHEAIVDQKPLSWFNGTSQVENAPISKARWTSMQVTSSAVNAENACTFTEQKHSIHRKTISCAVATKLAQPIAPRIISVNVCLMKSCCGISVR